MFLIYTDETGKDLKKGKDGTYRDGPFFIYGGLAFSEAKLSVVEVAFKELCGEILGIESPLITEVHTGDIFYRKGAFSNITEEQSKEFFREVFQLLKKFNLPFIAGLVFKDATIFQDDLFYVNSHSSTLNQLSDVVLFVLNVYFEVAFTELWRKDRILNLQRKVSFLEYLEAGFLSYLDNCAFLGFLEKREKSYDYAPLRLKDLGVPLYGLKRRFQSIVKVIVEMQTKGT